MANSELDANQVIQAIYDFPNNAIRVEGIDTGGIIDVPFDAQQITWISSGYGTGNPGTIQYYVGGLSGTLVATLVITYDVNNNPITVVRT